MNKIIITFFFLLFVVGFSGWLAFQTQSDFGSILIPLLIGGGSLLFSYFAYQKGATSPETEEESESENEDETEQASLPSFRFTVAGACYRDAATRYLLTLLPLYSEVLLEPEPTNPYDPNAIKVMLPNNIHIGYVPAKHCEEVLEMMNQYPNYQCVVASIRPGEKAPWIDVYIQLDTDEF